MQAKNSGLKTIETFCGDHQLSRSTFYRLLRSGAIKTVKIGAATRITPQHEAEWLASLPIVSGMAA